MVKSDFSQLHLNSLFRLCNLIRWLLLAFLSAQIIFFVLSWVVPMPIEIGPMFIQLEPDGMAEGSVRELSTQQRWAGILIGLPGLAALTYGVVHLGRALTHLQQGRIFALDTIAHLRSAAGAILLAVILFALELPLRWIALNVLDTGKGYPVTMDISSSELLVILVCSLFYLIVGVMHEGRRLSEENEGFI